MGFLQIWNLFLFVGVIENQNNKINVVYCSKKHQYFIISKYKIKKKRIDIKQTGL